jgi:hypothetical protein
VASSTQTLTRRCNPTTRFVRGVILLRCFRGARRATDMTTRFGVFQEAPGIGLGDPYVDAAKPDARDRGLNLKVSTCRQGKVSRRDASQRQRRAPGYRGRMHACMCVICSPLGSLRGCRSRQAISVRGAALRLMGMNCREGLPSSPKPRLSAPPPAIQPSEQRRLL